MQKKVRVTDTRVSFASRPSWVLLSLSAYQFVRFSPTKTRSGPLVLNLVLLRLGPAGPVVLFPGARFPFNRGACGPRGPCTCRRPVLTVAHGGEGPRRPYGLHNRGRCWLPRPLYAVNRRTLPDFDLGMLPLGLIASCNNLAYYPPAQTARSATGSSPACRSAVAGPPAHSPHFLLPRSARSSLMHRTRGAEVRSARLSDLPAHRFNQLWAHELALKDELEVPRIAGIEQTRFGEPPGSALRLKAET